MTITSTFALARALGGGATLSGIHALYIVSDFSPATGEVYGWPVDQSASDLKGTYQRLPDNLCEPMTDRAALMAPLPAGTENLHRLIGRARHDVYYGEKVTTSDKGRVLNHIGMKALLASTDPHLNDIPLSTWDNLSHRRAATIADGVCILKAAAWALIAEHNAKNEG